MVLRLRTPDMLFIAGTLDALPLDVVFPTHADNFVLSIIQTLFVHAQTLKHNQSLGLA